MTKARITRAEAITLGVLAVGAVGFGVYKYREQLYIQSLPRLMEEATQVTEPDQAMELTYREVGSTEYNCIPWDGIVEMRLSGARLYENYAQAQAAEGELGSSNGLLREDAPYLVIELEVSNVDAVETGYAWDVNADAPDHGVRLLSTGFLLCFGSFNDAKSPAMLVIDGQDCSDYESYFDLVQGGEATAFMGFSLDEDYGERLESAWLTYVSPFDKIDLSSVSLGGEGDGTSSQ